MQHRDVRAGRAEPGLDLQDAAWVGRHNDVRAGRQDGRDLLPLELARDLRMREVVDPRTSAAALDRRAHV